MVSPPLGRTSHTGCLSWTRGALTRKTWTRRHQLAPRACWRRGVHGGAWKVSVKVAFDDSPRHGRPRAGTHPCPRCSNPESVSPRAPRTCCPLPQCAHPEPPPRGRCPSTPKADILRHGQSEDTPEDPHHAHGKHQAPSGPAIAPDRLGTCSPRGCCSGEASRATRPPTGPGTFCIHRPRG